jgi:cilia- and flagella-associated protein 53
MGIAADWEVGTDRKIAKNAILRELTKLKAARNLALDTRREELAQKLYREEEALRSELVNSKETPEERRAALATRAKALWEAREAERQAEASALLDRHFRCFHLHARPLSAKFCFLVAPWHPELAPTAV